MALDGFTLSLLLEDLRAQLLGGRVDRIQQPEKDEITIMIRNGGANHRLVLSASGSNPRVHLTQRLKENPIQPPVFCMLLRARLTSGVLREIRQPGLERIAEFVFAARDELGYETELTLRLEVMGQRSNLILTDETGKILDSIRHVTEDMSRVREVLPGLRYEYPPAQDKVDPSSLSADDFSRYLLQMEGNSDLARQIGARFQGIAPRTAQILAYAAQMDGLPNTWEEEDVGRYARWLEDLFRNKRKYLKPCVMLEEDLESDLDFLPFPHPAYPQDRFVFMDNLSDAMDRFYLKKDGQERKRQHTARIRQILKRNMERCEKKLSIQNRILEELPATEEIRIQAELLTAFGYMAQKGASSVTVPNYYENNEPMEIALDPSKNVQVFAQQLFKKYRKAHVAGRMAEEQIRGIREEMAYLEELEAAADLCQDEQSIRDLEQEMIAARYIKPAAGKKQRKEKMAAPMKFTAPSGAVIRVGRNPAQNDQLTLHMTGPKDIWFHAQGIPGSHAILFTSGQEPSREDMECAAMLAAYYSKGREDTTVSVDYTQRKNIRKPAGAKPGFVIYQPFHTLIVKPDPKLLAERGIKVK